MASTRDRPEDRKNYEYWQSEGGSWEQVYAERKRRSVYYHLQELAIVDYVCVSASLDERIAEYADHLHEHFFEPCDVRGGRYCPPRAPGFSSDLMYASSAAMASSLICPWYVGISGW